MLDNFTRAIDISSRALFKTIKYLRSICDLCHHVTIFPRKKPNLYFFNKKENMFFSNVFFYSKKTVCFTFLYVYTSQSLGKNLKTL